MADTTCNEHSSFKPKYAPHIFISTKTNKRITYLRQGAIFPATHLCRVFPLHYSENPLKQTEFLAIPMAKAELLRFYCWQEN
jgi:hypothetical protein